VLTNWHRFPHSKERHNMDFSGVFDDLIKVCIIIGIVIGLAAVGLVWGGCKFCQKYSVKIEKKVPVVATNVVTIYQTNVITK